MARFLNSAAVLRRGDGPFRPLRRSSAAPVVPFQSVNADGWSVTYADPVVASPEPVTVQRQGYVGTTPATITETLYCTTRVRLPYPDQATLSADRVALSDYIYSTDTVAGATNNSAETSPKPVANWGRRDRRMSVVAGSFPREWAEVLAYHRNARSREQVAAVRWSFSDGVDSVVVTQSASSLSPCPYDKLPVTAYLPSDDVDISALADGQITMRAEVFPHIGASASILDSADQTGAREFSTLTFVKAASAAPNLVYVDAATGNNLTGVVSTDAATAKASPCQTIAGAILRLVAVAGDTGGAEIRCMAGTHVWNSTGIVVTQAHTARLVVTRDPDELRSAVTVTFGSAAIRQRLGTAGGWQSLRGLTVVRTGTSQPSGEVASLLELTFEDCAFDNGSISAAIPGGSCDLVLCGVDFTNLGGSLAGSRELRMLRGCDVPSSPTAIDGWLVVGSTVPNSSGGLTAGVRTYSGAIIAHNRATNIPSSVAFVGFGATADVAGAAVVQNVFEFTSATSAPAIRVSADSETGDNEHVILHHNTFAGFFANGRANIFYEDGATPRTSRLMSCRANIHVQINTKGDVFVADGARVGNWAYLYGVGCQGEFSQFIDADAGGLGGSFAQAYPGLGANIGTSASVRNDPLFVDYQGTTSGPTAGAGGGDYALQSGSPAKSMAQATIKYDAAGAERTASSSAGAYQ